MTTQNLILVLFYNCAETIQDSAMGLSGLTVLSITRRSSTNLSVCLDFNCPLMYQSFTADNICGARHCTMSSGSIRAIGTPATNPSTSTLIALALAAFGKQAVQCTAHHQWASSILFPRWPRQHVTFGVDITAFQMKRFKRDA